MSSVSPLRIFLGSVCQEENQPLIRTVCLTSGGGDSTVLAHSCRDFYDELVHIDTGTALPGVRDFVHEFAEFVDKPLRVVEAGDAYKRLVLGEDHWWPIYVEWRREAAAGERGCLACDGDGFYMHKDRKTRCTACDDGIIDAERSEICAGFETPDEFRVFHSRSETREERMGMGVNIAPMGFPGPAGHKFAYQRLKERQLEQVLRDIKSEHGNSKRKQRVALLSGVRLDESARRKMTGSAQGEWERRGNQVWINPLLYWTNEQMREYRAEHGLPVSDVTALIHKSGECQCLAFAAKGEREFIISLFPTWYSETIRPIEDAARARGLKHWQWGWGAGELGMDPNEIPEASGPMCRACDLRMGLVA